MFWVSKNQNSTLRKVQNFHICLWSGPRGLPLPPLTDSLTVKRPFFKTPLLCYTIKMSLLTPFKALIDDRMVIRYQMIITNNLTWEPQKNIQSFPLWPELSGMKDFKALGGHWTGWGHNFFWIFLNFDFPCSMVITYQNRNRRDWQEELEEPM